MGVKVSQLDGQPGMWIFFCPGCQCGHWFNTNPANRGPVWTFNGDVEKPTVRASILVHEGKDNPGFRKQPRCHSFVTDGNIRFLDDCTHELAGQTVPLPDLFGKDLLGKEDDG